jgi:hypothetical protein
MEPNFKRGIAVRIGSLLVKNYMRCFEPAIIRAGQQNCYEIFQEARAKPSHMNVIADSSK